MLIRRAEVNGVQLADVRIVGESIHEIAAQLSAQPDEVVLDAHGGALFPGLHDHHLHLFATAAAQQSVVCGPPQVADAPALSAALHRADGTGWLRGVGYHESVAGELCRAWLDAYGPQRPVRIQHRSGRLWILNSPALAALPDATAEQRETGRFYDADGWLRARLPSQRPDLTALSRQLMALGVTGLTDTSHGNGPEELAYFSDAQRRGELLQDICVMGDARLDGVVQAGAHKFHLHDHDLPDFETTVAAIRRSHEAGRVAAFHCVTRTDLTFALALLREAGVVMRGDRIEHAAVTPPDLLEQLAQLGLIVVTQPQFIAERGDSYRAEVAPEDQPWLYRLQGFLDAGIPLAAGSDAPYGDLNPWRAMQAAVTRRTTSGVVMAAAEALTPEQALDLFLAPLREPAAPARRVAVGVSADLCLLTQPWRQARLQLDAVEVCAVFRAGKQQKS